MEQLLEFLKEHENTLFVIFSILAIFMGIGVIIWRNNETKTPLYLKKIIIPPIMMSTGALMFVFPYFRLAETQILEAIGVGLVFSTLLLFTTKYERKGEELFVKPSKLFPIILVGLLVIRTAMKQVMSVNTTPGEIGGMFFLLAFTMIVIWRSSMLINYMKFKKSRQ